MSSDRPGDVGQVAGEREVLLHHGPAAQEAGARLHDGDGHEVVVQQPAQQRLVGEAVVPDARDVHQVVLQVPRLEQLGEEVDVEGVGGALHQGGLLVRRPHRLHAHQLHEHEAFGGDGGHGQDAREVPLAHALDHAGVGVLHHRVEAGVEVRREHVEDGVEHLLHGLDHRVQRHEAGAVAEAGVLDGGRVAVEVPAGEGGGEEAAQGVAAHEDLGPPLHRVGHVGGDHRVDVPHGQLHPHLGDPGGLFALDEALEGAAVEAGPVVVVVDGDVGVARGLRRVQAGEVLQPVGAPLHRPHLDVAAPLPLCHVHQLPAQVVEDVGPAHEAGHEQQDGVGLHVALRAEAEVLDVVHLGGGSAAGPRQGRVDRLLRDLDGRVHLGGGPGAGGRRVGVLRHRPAGLVAAAEQAQGEQQRARQGQGDKGPSHDSSSHRHTRHHRSRVRESSLWANSSLALYRLYSEFQEMEDIGKR